jgi:hypothetical protein
MSLVATSRNARHKVEMLGIRQSTPCIGVALHTRHSHHKADMLDTRHRLTISSGICAASETTYVSLKSKNDFFLVRLTQAGQQLVSVVSF